MQDKRSGGRDRGRKDEGREKGNGVGWRKEERKKGGMEKGGPKEGSRSDSPCPVCVYVLI